MSYRDPQARRDYHNAFYAQPAQRKRRAIEQRAYRQRKRLVIFKRDGFLCAYCQIIYTAGSLTIDHKFPRTLGGSDTDTNKVTACKDCNRKKGKMTYDEYLLIIDPTHVPSWVTEEN